MPEISDRIEILSAELDAAVEAHMNWTRRVMRCAVLKVSPGEDVLHQQAHTLCRFGHWFRDNRAVFEKIDEAKTIEIDRIHTQMHGAIREICSGILDGTLIDVGRLDEFEQTQAELLRQMAWYKTAFLQHAMRLDALTGLPMRYGIKTEFEQAMKVCQRDGTTLYLAMIDADHFKDVNDRYGHAAGDQALCHLSCVLKSIIRPSEPLYRYGGEEFVLLLQCITHEAAAAAAQRIVQRVRGSPLILATGETLALTVTLGVAPVAEGESLDSALARADKALYKGKSEGRNRYCIEGE